MTKGELMLKVALELINIDEDQAEKCVEKTIETLSLIVHPIKKSIVVEPHDDVRGVWARFDVKDVESPSSSFNKALAAAIKSIVLMQVHPNTKAVVHVVIGNDKGEKEHE